MSMIASTGRLIALGLLSWLLPSLPARAQSQPAPAPPTMMIPSPSPAGAAPGVTAPFITPIGPPLYPTVAAPVLASPVIMAPPSLVVLPPVAPLVPAASYPMAVPAAPGTYIVKKGAHLAVVAKRTGTDLRDLIRLNPTLKPDSLLPAGTRVLLPIPGSW